MLRTAAVAVALLLGAGCASSSTAAPNSVFGADVTAALAHASVPAYLPSWIPPFDGPRKTLYATATLYPQGYLVNVDPVKGCNGANVCSFLAVTGRSGSPDAGGEAATLQDGTKAWFYPITCGASCSAASLEWARNGNTYGIEMKGGDEATLLRVASSCVPER